MEAPARASIDYAHGQFFCPGLGTGSCPLWIAPHPKSLAFTAIKGKLNEIDCRRGVEGQDALFIAVVVSEYPCDQGRENFDLVKGRAYDWSSN